MIIPGIIVGRIYRKRSLRREEGDYYSFAFKNTLARGTATLIATDRILVKSSIGSLELSRFPELFVDDRPVKKEDTMMIIGGQEVPHYDEEEAKKRVGESISFVKGDDFITRIRGDLPDGRHVFRSVFHSRQFGEIVLNFSDYMGEAPRLSLWDRIVGLFRPFGTGIKVEATPKAVKETKLYILKDRRPDPDFGRLLSAFKLNEPDRVPLMELEVDEEVKAAFLGRPVADMRDEVEFWLAAGYDYVPIFIVNITPRNISVIDSHKTTYREGLQERAWVVETEGIITTQEDFDSCEWPEIDDSVFANFDEIGKHLPPEMKLMGCVSTVFETVTQAMGLQTFCMNIYDRPELISAMFEKAGNLIGRCVERMLQYDWLGAVWITDDLGYKQGTIIAPEMLRKYAFPWYRKYAEMVHNKGLPILMHSCGNIKELFEDIIETGIDALHPLEANAVDIYDARREIGDRICLCGNLDLSYMLTLGGNDEIVEDVKRHLRELAPRGGYCLGSSNSIPNYVPLDKYLTMNRTCLELGRYPIAI